MPHGPHADHGVLRRAGDLMNAERLHDSISTVRTQIEDLQAEVEAGARCVDKIQSDVKTIDDRTLNYFRHTARTTALLQCADELKKSIEEQRDLLRELRRSVDQVRQSMRERRR